MSTILLDTVAWDLVIDAAGNIAAAEEPYALAQDAASAIRTFLGECYWDTTVGVPYLQSILAKTPSISTVKQFLQAAAESVPGVASAQVFITGISDRIVSGQVQVKSTSTGKTSAANFSTVNPQGAG